jgi:hypothetical protein
MHSRLFSSPDLLILFESSIVTVSLQLKQTTKTMMRKQQNTSRWIMLLTLPFLFIIRAGFPFQQHVGNLLAVSLTKPRNVESSQKLGRSK